jgi:hypothetical protein
VSWAWAVATGRRPRAEPQRWEDRGVGAASDLGPGCGRLAADRQRRAKPWRMERAGVVASRSWERASANRLRCWRERGLGDGVMGRLAEKRSAGCGRSALRRGGAGARVESNFWIGLEEVLPGNLAHAPLNPPTDMLLPLLQVKRLVIFFLPVSTGVVRSHPTGIAFRESLRELIYNHSVLWWI